MLTVSNLVGLGAFTPAAAGGLLLDSITAVPLGAWSFRKLRTAYAGSAIRLRGFDDVEDDIGFSGNDFDTVGAEDHLTAHGSPGLIAKMYDQSGAGNDFVQASEVMMATYNATGLNSLPCGVFDGSNDELITANITLAVKKLSLFFVGRLASGGGDFRTVAWNPNMGLGTWDNTENVLIFRWASDVIEGYYNASSRGTRALTQPNNARIAAIWDGTNATMFVGGSGGTPVAADISAIGNPGPLRVGGDGQGAWPGPIGEVLFFDEPPSGGDQSTINSNQLAYWGF